MSYGQQIVSTVSNWDGIEAHPHRFGGTEFNLGNVEVGHIHGSHMVDIPFTVKLREALVETGAAQPHHLLHESGWISFYLRQDADVEQALQLFRLSYLQKRLSRARGDQREALLGEIASLSLPAQVKDVLLKGREVPSIE
ncbi:MAG: DUF5519 family protein [bacterium]|nr:DUF5519 family protein [bacterium]